MKNKLYLAIAFLLISVLPLMADGSRRIWFDTPCSDNNPPVWKKYSNLVSAGAKGQNGDWEWENRTLPIGNGSIGASIFGSVSEERISFNEKSLWRGGPASVPHPEMYWDVNKKSAHILPEIRQELENGNAERAQYLLEEYFSGTVQYHSDREENFRFGNYTTAGEFRILTDIDGKGITGYCRELSLDSAMVSVSFRKDDVKYRREYFISYPANVMVVRFTSDSGKGQNLQLRYFPNPLMSSSYEKDGDTGLKFSGRLSNNGMRYVMRARVLAEGGRTDVSDNGVISVSGADEVTFIISADTDYTMNFEPDYDDRYTYAGTNPDKTTAEWIGNACDMGYAALLNGHLEDYSRLFSRVDFALNENYPDDAVEQLPTDLRMKRYREGKPDYSLESLYYNFGRYLLVSSSRPGNLPANLQGIWHNNIDGPWRVDYHNNINIQMNYWPACPANLSECELPLFDFIRTLVVPGTETAESYFGARGWTASISANIFGFTSPLAGRGMNWNYIPMAGPWLATHIWRYYDYTRDLHFLEKYYPVLKGAADFAADCAYRRPDGFYSISPSTSPEHGKVDAGATFANAVLKEILDNAYMASEILDADEVTREQWEKISDAILPYRIGRYGQLQEWSEDIDSPFDEHRHVNHLFGLYPGHSISVRTTPELADASRVVLEHRRDGASGWSMGWKLNLWAHLQDGDRAYRLFGNLLKHGTADNLFDIHPPFQIDGNFGGITGISEMICQSSLGITELLPALPSVWHQGHMKGVRTTGNFVLDVYWKDNVLEHVTVFSGSGIECSLIYRDMNLTFPTIPGKSYIVTFDEGNHRLVLGGEI